MTMREITPADLRGLAEYVEQVQQIDPDAVRDWGRLFRPSVNAPV